MSELIRNQQVASSNLAVGSSIDAGSVKSQATQHREEDHSGARASIPLAPARPRGIEQAGFSHSPPTVLYRLGALTIGGPFEQTEGALYAFLMIGGHVAKPD